MPATRTDGPGRVEALLLIGHAALERGDARGVLPDQVAQLRGTLGAQVGALAGVGGCDEHQTGQGEHEAAGHQRGVEAGDGAAGRPAHSPTVTARSPGVAGWTLLG